MAENCKITCSYCDPNNIPKQKPTIPVIISASTSVTASNPIPNPQSSCTDNNPK